MIYIISKSPLQQEWLYIYDNKFAFIESLYLSKVQGNIFFASVRINILTRHNDIFIIPQPDKVNIIECLYTIYIIYRLSAIFAPYSNCLRLYNYTIRIILIFIPYIHLISVIIRQRNKLYHATFIIIIFALK